MFSKFKFLLFFLFLAPVVAKANDPFNAQKREAGRFVETYSITVSSSVPTLLLSPSAWNATADIFNNSAYTLWVGTNTSTLQTTGFPILSSTTYTTDGQFTGALYGLADSAAGGSTNARTIEYKMRED